MEMTIAALAPATRLTEPPLTPRLKITKFVLLPRAAKIFGLDSADAYISSTPKRAHHFSQGQCAAAEGGSRVKPALPQPNLHRGQI